MANDGGDWTRAGKMMPNGDPAYHKAQGASDDELVSINRLMKAQESLKYVGTGTYNEDGEWVPGKGPGKKPGKNKDGKNKDKGKVQPADGG